MSRVRRLARCSVGRYHDGARQMSVVRGRLPTQDVEVAPKSEPRIPTLRAQVLAEFRRFGVIDDNSQIVNPQRYDGTLTER